VILLGLAVGALLGLLAVPAVARLPHGIPERLAQPAWTARAGRPVVLCTVGAVLGALLGAAAPDHRTLALGLVLLAVLLPATAIDIAWRVVPDTLVVLGALGGLAVVALVAPDQLVPHLIAGLVGGVGALLVALAARGGFGLGDVKVIAMIGLVLGAALPLAVVGGLLIAGLISLPILLARGRGATLPLVPFLAAGALVACLAPARAAIGL
jgi:prepilin signal peptidase PulO-like enzyme (type II secretory pathway)